MNEELHGNPHYTLGRFLGLASGIRSGSSAGFILKEILVIEKEYLEGKEKNEATYWVGRWCHGAQKGDVMKPRNFFVLLILAYLLATTAAHCQTMQHAPTAEQCRADIAVWKAQSEEQIIQLPFYTLNARVDELSECDIVLRDVKDLDGEEWSNTIEAAYNQHRFVRAMHFLERHDLSLGFLDEDEKGAR